MKLASVLTVCVVGAGALAATASATPPPGRAYELVSPVDDPSGAFAGLTTDMLPAPGIASDTGDRVLYAASSSMGSAWSGQPNAMIFGRRTENGWKARTATVSLDHGDTPAQLGATEASWGWMTPDGLTYTYHSGNPGAIPLPPGAPYPYPAVLRATDGDGMVPEWVSKPIDGIIAAPSSGGANYVQRVLFTNRDASIVALRSREPLTANAPAAEASAVYVSRGGTLELASKLPNGSAADDASFACENDRPAPVTNFCSAMAGDGRFVLFTVSGSSPQAGLYVRDLTLNLTRQLSGPAVGRPVLSGESIAATLGGSRVVFSAQNDYYEADLATGTVTPRPAITGEPVAISPDAGRMMFLVKPESGSGDDRTLRLWSAASPATSQAVATLGTETSPAPHNQVWFRFYKALDAGQTWIFTAGGSLDPARPNAAPTTHQLYRWSVGDSAPACLSCAPTDGVSRTTGVNLSVQQFIGTESILNPLITDNQGTGSGFSQRKLAQPGHAASDDGRWILFDSPDRLTAEDANDVRDVYLWDRDGGSGGELQLVTSGQGNAPSYALDIDPTGKNAFFSTREGLVPADENLNYNVYVARIGGGFPASPESCVAEECRPAVIPDPPTGSVVSNVLTDVPAGPRSSAQKGQPELRVRSVRASSRQLTVRVVAPKSGRIRVSGKGVRTTNRTAKRATTYTVRVSLSKDVRRRVAAGKRVKINLRVQFTPKGSKKSTRVSSSVSIKKGR